MQVGEPVAREPHVLGGLDRLLVVVLQREDADLVDRARARELHFEPIGKLVERRVVPPALAFEAAAASVAVDRGTRGHRPGVIGEARTRERRAPLAAAATLIAPIPPPSPKRL